LTLSPPPAPAATPAEVLDDEITTPSPTRSEPSSSRPIRTLSARLAFATPSAQRRWSAPRENTIPPQPGFIAHSGPESLPCGLVLPPSAQESRRRRRRGRRSRRRRETAALEETWLTSLARRLGITSVTKEDTPSPLSQPAAFTTQRSVVTLDALEEGAGSLSGAFVNLALSVEEETSRAPSTLRRTLSDPSRPTSTSSMPPLPSLDSSLASSALTSSEPHVPQTVVVMVHRASTDDGQPGDAPSPT